MSGTPTILFEDNHVIVALKEPGLLTQGDRTGDRDMLSLLKAYIRDKYEKPGDAYLGLVHRMDRPVGGLLCFARTSKAAARLSKQIAERSFVREYLCICHGTTPDRFTLQDYLLKDRELNRVSVVPSYLRIGREAVLHAKTIRSQEEFSLVAIRLETGRAHQIRAQMAHAKHPLAGDRRYGAKDAEEAMALWGMRLGFTHPITKAAMVFIAPPPPTRLWTLFNRDIRGLENVWPDIGPRVPRGGDDPDVQL